MQCREYLARARFAAASALVDRGAVLGKSLGLFRGKTDAKRTLVRSMELAHGTALFRRRRSDKTASCLAVAGWIKRAQRV